MPSNVRRGRYEKRRHGGADVGAPPHFSIQKWRGKFCGRGAVCGETGVLQSASLDRWAAPTCRCDMQVRHAGTTCRYDIQAASEVVTRYLSAMLRSRAEAGLP